MAIDKFKDVTIAGHEFCLGRVSAETGSWVMTQVGLDAIGKADVYRQITHHLFNLISVYNVKDGKRIPVKIYQDGEYLAPELDLDYDLELFETLYKESWDYNFGPFFAKRKKLHEEAVLAHKRSTTNQ